MTVKNITLELTRSDLKMLLELVEAGFEKQSDDLDDDYVSEVYYEYEALVSMLKKLAQ